MTKDKWNEVYSIFEKAYNDFQMEYQLLKMERIKKSEKLQKEGSITAFKS